MNLKIILSGLLTTIAMLFFVKQGSVLDNHFFTLILVGLFNLILDREYKRMLQIVGSFLIYVALVCTSLFIGILIGLL